jgi:hypothetical protein
MQPHKNLVGQLFNTGMKLLEAVASVYAHATQYTLQEV